MLLLHPVMALFIGIASFVIFLFFQALGIFTGDSGDVVTAAVVHGVPILPVTLCIHFWDIFFAGASVHAFMARDTLVVSASCCNHRIGVCHRVPINQKPSSWSVCVSGAAW